jgi:hypothetical protein
LKTKEEESMKSVKSVLTTLTAVLLGGVAGAFLARPPKAHAIGSTYFINVQKVKEGSNAKSALTGSHIIGFACTEQDCYVATTEE